MIIILIHQWLIIIIDNAYDCSWLLMTLTMLMMIDFYWWLCMTVDEHWRLGWPKNCHIFCNLICLQTAQTIDCFIYIFFVCTITKYCIHPLLVFEVLILHHNPFLLYQTSNTFALCHCTQKPEYLDPKCNTRQQNWY